MKAGNVLLVIITAITMLIVCNAYSNTSASISNSNYEEMKMNLNMDYEVWVFENGEWWIYVYNDSGVIKNIYQPPND